MFSFFSKKTALDLKFEKLLKDMENTDIQWRSALIQIKDKKRKIIIPNEEGKRSLKSLLYIITDNFSCHSQCFSYQKNLSYKNMVLLHEKNFYLLKMDLKNFYSNVCEEDVSKVLLEKCSKVITDRLLKFLILPNEGLPTGSPVSPYLSNLVLYKLDVFLYNQANLSDLIYTRYGDDLFFSSNNKECLQRVPNLVETYLTLNHKQLKLNVKKTQLNVAPYRIGAFTVHPNKILSLKKPFKRQLRMLLHKHSIDELSDEEIPSLKGHLLYCFGNDPNYFWKLLTKFQNVLTDVIRMPV